MKIKRQEIEKQKINFLREPYSIGRCGSGSGAVDGSHPPASRCQNGGSQVQGLFHIRIILTAGFG